MACAEVLFTFVLLVMAQRHEGAKVLMLPTSIGSHMRLHTRLGVELTTEGHEVTLAWPSHVKFPEAARGTKLEVLIYKVHLKESYMNSKEHAAEIVKYAMTESFMEKMDMMNDMLQHEMHGFEMECEDMFADEVFMKKVRSAKFDLALVDAACISCYYMLPYSMDLPYISLSIPVAPPLLYRVPALPSFTADILLEYTNEMSFQERMVTLLAQLSFMYMVNDTAVDHFSAKYAPGKPKLGVYGMTLRSAMFFFLDDDIVLYPKPQMPNTISIGDIMGRPSQTLPADLLEFVESSKEGVIIVSFGSFINDIPEEVIRKICDALKRVNQNIIWKLKNPEYCQIPEKLLALKWIPQNDLLGHPNVKLFITHGGISSFFETVYHATPVIACPLFLDQVYTAKVYDAKHYGKYIRLLDFTSQELLDKINTVLSDKLIAEKIQLASMLLRNKPQTAAKRASYWIDHVAKYGSDHLRSSAFELNPYQFFMIDLFFCIFVVLLFFVLLSLGCLYCAFKLIMKCCKKTDMTKQKIN